MVQNKKFDYIRWVLHHKRMHYHLKRLWFVPTKFTYNFLWKFVDFRFYSYEMLLHVDTLKIRTLGLVQTYVSYFQFHLAPLIMKSDKFSDNLVKNVHFLIFSVFLSVYIISLGWVLTDLKVIFSESS